MSIGFDNEREDRLLTSAQEENFISDDNPVEKKEESEEYYELPLAIRSRTLIWSAISVVLGILSLALCPFYYVSLTLSLCSVGFSVVSRRNLGFFERYAVIGLILGIIGFVFGIFSLAADLLGIFG